MILHVEEPLLSNDTEQNNEIYVSEEFAVKEKLVKISSTITYHHNTVGIKNCGLNGILLDSFINNISSSTDIMYLDLSCNGIKDEDLVKIGSLFKYIPKLISLKLSNNNITGQGLVLVRNEILENCKNLLEIDISHNQIKFEDGKLFFFKLYQLPNLKFINLSYNITGDSDMKLFALFIDTFDHDIYVDLEGNEIREVGLITLHHKLKKNKMKLINFGLNVNKMSIVGLMQYYFSSK